MVTVVALFVMMSFVVWGKKSKVGEASLSLAAGTGGVWNVSKLYSATLQREISEYSIEGESPCRIVRTPAEIAKREEYSEVNGTIKDMRQLGSWMFYLTEESLKAFTITLEGESFNLKIVREVANIRGKGLERFVILTLPNGDSVFVFSNNRNQVSYLTHSKNRAGKLFDLEDTLNTTLNNAYIVNTNIFIPNGVGGINLYKYSYEERKISKIQGTPFSGSEHDVRDILIWRKYNQQNSIMRLLTADYTKGIQQVTYNLSQNTHSSPETILELPGVTSIIRSSFDDSEFLTAVSESSTALSQCLLTLRVPSADLSHLEYESLDTINSRMIYDGQKGRYTLYHSDRRIVLCNLMKGCDEWEITDGETIGRLRFYTTKDETKTLIVAARGKKMVFYELAVASSTMRCYETDKSTEFRFKILGTISDALATGAAEGEYANYYYVDTTLTVVETGFEEQWLSTKRTILITLSVWSFIVLLLYVTAALIQRMAKKVKHAI